MLLLYYYSYGEHCWVFLQICMNFNTKWRASNTFEARSGGPQTYLRPATCKHVINRSALHHSSAVFIYKRYGCYTYRSNLVYFINVSVTMSASTIIGNFELNITMSSDSSQNSDMTEDQLDKMVNDTRPKSTQRSTDWGIRKARASNQCPASNRQTRASNNHNALQMNVIVILTL